MRMGNWKMIVAADHTFLFDLDSDIGETKTLAEQRPEIVRKLKEWQSQMKPPARPSKPNRRIVDIDGIPYELNI